MEFPFRVRETFSWKPPRLKKVGVIIEGGNDDVNDNNKGDWKVDEYDNEYLEDVEIVLLSHRQISIVKI